MTPSEIQALRGTRSRAELAERLGVTPLTVYRWELPEDAAEARRPRGKVLARLLELAHAERAQREGLEAGPSSPRENGAAIEADEKAALRGAFAAMDECRLSDAETQLIALLSSGTLRSAGARAWASAMLARVCLLARHDTKGAFSALLGVANGGAGLPRAVQLDHHLTAAFLYAHADKQLFNAGKTNHHIALAEQLLGEGNGDHRFFLWFAQYTAAATLYDFALIARAMEALPAMRELATTPLHRCMCAEAATVSSLGLTSTTEAARRLDELGALAAQRGLPLQELRGRIWRAEVAVEEAAPPAQILALLEEAEQLMRQHRIGSGLHVMMMRRNLGETLIRLGQLQRAERVLLDDVRVAHELAYTPIRIYTTLARLYLQTAQIEALASIAAEAIAASDEQRDLTRASGHVLALLCDVCRGDAASDACDRVLAGMEELRRLGVWPIAYRHLALVALSVFSTRGAARDAERTVQLAERAVELSPSPIATAALRRHRATVLIRRGKLTEARHALEAALATLQASEDVAEAAFVRRALANVDVVEGAPCAAQALAATEAELSALGVPLPELVQADAPEPGVSAEEPCNARAHAGEIERLVVPLQRLATRGSSEALLGKELVALTGGLLSGASVTLEEIHSDGRTTELARHAASARDDSTWIELGDGLGRRLRLGVNGSLDAHERALLEVIATTAGLAFEVAALRSLPAAPRRPEPAAAPEPPALADVVAASATMRKLKTELGRLSGSRATIILTGESGTGKEVIARAIHQLSRRAAGPYITFNSAAVPRELFEGQLFGHKKGAFTGAQADHPGVIRSAEGGTLFLDEIGELPLDVQPKLLRFLENAEVMPLGGREPVTVDVRVIAATHRDLRALVREGKFREDLYYRLQVVPVEIAPLRERREDIVALAQHFVRKLTPSGEQAPVLTADAETRLLAYPWPGNVRELRNVIERTMAFEPLPRSIGAAELRM